MNDRTVRSGPTPHNNPRPLPFGIRLGRMSNRPPR